MSETNTTETKKAPTKRDVKAAFDAFRIALKPELSAAEVERQRRLDEFGSSIGIAAAALEEFGKSASAFELIGAIKNLQGFLAKGNKIIAATPDAALLADDEDEAPAPKPVTRRVKKLEEPAPTPAPEAPVVEEPEVDPIVDEPEEEPAPEPEDDQDDQDDDEVEPMTEDDVADETPAALAELTEEEKTSKPEESFEEYAARQKALREAKTAEAPAAAAPAVGTRQVRSGPGTRVAKPVEDNEGF